MKIALRSWDETMKITWAESRRVTLQVYEFFERQSPLALGKKLRIEWFIFRRTLFLSSGSNTPRTIATLSLSLSLSLFLARRRIIRRSIAVRFLSDSVCSATRFVRIRPRSSIIGQISICHGSLVKQQRSTRASSAMNFQARENHVSRIGKYLPAEGGGSFIIANGEAQLSAVAASLRSKREIVCCRGNSALESVIAPRSLSNSDTGYTRARVYFAPSTGTG